MSKKIQKNSNFLLENNNFALWRLAERFTLECEGSRIEPAWGQFFLQNYIDDGESNGDS